MMCKANVSVDELRELCTLTVELTRLRQSECKHLCIENFAPDLLWRLIMARVGVESDGVPEPMPVQGHT